MAFNNLRMEDFFLSAQVAIENSIGNSEISGAVAVFGYNSAKLDNGKLLYDEVMTLHTAQVKEYSEQYGATENFQNKFDIADKSYRKFKKIARVAIKDNEMLSKLGLTSVNKRTFGSWFDEALLFYNGALSDQGILNRFANFGITDTKLTSGRNQVISTKAANLSQEKKKGEAQRATEQRDAAIEKLSAWVDDYLVIAEIALEDDPQLLEIIGVKA